MSGQMVNKSALYQMTASFPSYIICVFSLRVYGVQTIWTKPTKPKSLEVTILLLKKWRSVY